MNRKGLMKGVIQAGIVFALVFALFFTAYMLLASATVVLTSTNTVFANATFDTNQSGIEMNLTINITSIGGGQVTPIKTIYINISQAGFTNISAEHLRCPDNATGTSGVGATWVNSSPLTGLLACNASAYNFTGAVPAGANNTLTGIVQVRIVNLSARTSPGTPNFNVSIEYNTTSGFISNSSLVIVTILELQANATVNDTTSQIHEQRSYNFTITNNASDADNFDTIDQITILYTGSGFTDTGDPNATCSRIPPTTGVQWDRTNNSALNTITCSKPTGTGSALGKGSSTNIVVNNWGASPTAGTKRFTIIVNGTNANGTYTIANESSPNVVVNGTINVTGTSVTPSTVAINATNVTLMRYAFTTVGEQFNVSVIKVTLSGTAAAGDIDGVRLVNDTSANNALDSTDTPVFNASALSADRQYVFAGINFIVRDNNTLLLVANISGAATAGRTYRFNINASSDINSLGGSSGANVTEVNGTSLQSAQGTIHGRLQVTGYNLAPATKAVNTANLAMVYFELNATGEGINITVFNVTRTGSAADADVLLVRLFNDTNNNAAFDSGTDTQLGAALNASSSGQYVFSGFQFNVTTGSSPHRLIVVTNISSATANRLFSFGLNNSGDINVVAATTGENLTGSSNLSFGSAQSGTTQIHGTLSVVGKALNPNNTAISTAGIAALLLNFTASGEQVNITQINITRTGTATDGDGIFNVTLYNDTDRSGTFSAGDLAIGTVGVNTTTASAYLFRTISYNVTTAGSSLIVVVSTNGSAITGGATFNLSLNSTGSINAFTASANVNITGSTNISLTTTNGNVTRIFGTLAIAGTDLTPATVNDGQLDVPILNITLTATGEQMNITQINVSMNNTNNDDVAAAKLYNDTDRSNSINVGDFLVATATKTGSLLVFGTGTSQLLNVSATAATSLILAYDVNSTATGGNLLDANLSIAGHALVTGNSSALSITSSGLPLNPVGESQVTDLVATATIDFLNTKITATDPYNFTISNTGGEEINSIMIDYTASAFVDITTEPDVLCPRIAGANWTRTINNATNTMNCTSPGGANNLVVSAITNLFIRNFQAPTSAGNKTFTVQVRGTSGGFYNVTTNGVTVSGLLNITGTSQIASTVVVNSRNVSVIRYNITASGEQMNITVIKLTRAGRNSRESDIVNIKLFNDTNADGTYTATTDTTQIGSTLTANNTAGQYDFAGLTFFVPTNGNMSLFAVIEVGNASTTIIRQLNLSINTTTDVDAIGSTTGVNITENLTGTTSTSSSIFGNLTVTGTSLVNSTVPIGTETAVMRLNFTSLGEGFNITLINVSVIGTATEANLTNVRLVNDTNGNGVFDSGDATLGPQWNATSGVTFKLLNTTTQFNISTSGVNSVFIVVNTSTAAGAGGKTFNLSINGTGDIEAVGAVTATNVTEVLTTTTSNQATIGGTLSVTGKNLAPSTVAINAAGVAILQLNFSATNEGMNISIIKITRSGTVAEGEIFNITLFNDTDVSGTFNAGDTRIGTTQNTTTGGKYIFTGFQYNVTTLQGNNTLFVVVTTNSTAGNTFNLSLASAADIDSIGATSAANVTETLSSAESSTTTIHGTTTATGKTIAPTLKAVNTAGLAVLQLNFTSSGEGMNLSVLNITRTGTVVDGDVYNVSLFNDTDVSGTFNAGDTRIGNPLNTSASGQYVFPGLGFNFPAGGKTLFVVLTINDSSTTGGKSLNFSLASRGDYSVIGATSGENLTGSTNITLTNTTSSVVTSTHGTLSITGSSQAGSTTPINRNNVSLMRYNFTPTGENIIVSVLNVTRAGSATDSDIVNVAFYNDTDSSGTFNAGDNRVGAVLNSSSSGVYTFNGLAYNVTPGRVNTLFLVINTTAGATPANAFNFTINATGDVSAVGSNSTVNVTATANITLTTMQSTTSTVHGILTVTGTSRSPATIAVDTANLAILQLNFTATGEGFNISLINITINGTATEANLTNVRLFNDTNGNGAFNAAADTQIGPALNTTTTAAKFAFGGFQYNVSTSGVNTLFVVVNTSGAVGTGGTRFTLSLNKTGDIQLVGASSSRNITADANVTLTTPESVATTIHGQVTFTGTNVVASAVSVSTAGISVLRINITPLGEGINVTVLNVTRGGNASDGHIFNVTLFNDTDLSGTFNAGDGAIGTVGLNTTTSGNYVFSGFQFNVSTTGKSLFLVVTSNDTADVTFNLALNGTGAVNLIGATTGENLTGTSNITLTSAGSATTEIVSLSITGRNLAPATAAINTANVSVLLINLTAGGEGMNISVIKITRNESATDSDIALVRLFNDTDLSGTFNSGDTQIGAAVNTTSASQYEFAGLTYNIPQGGRKSLIVVVNTSSAAATGGKTFRFNINATGDVNTITETTANNVTETLTTPLSNRLLIHGLVTFTGKVLNADFVEINTGGFSVLQLNITATSEGANVTVLNITRTGTAVDGNIFNVTLFNDTDLSGTFNSGDTRIGNALNTTSPSNQYVFTGFQYNVSAGSDKTLFIILSTNSSSTIGGLTFNLSLVARGDVSLIGGTSAENLTGSTNITLTTTQSNTTKIFGTLTMTGTHVANTTIAFGSSNMSIMRYNLSATGEGMNVSVIKITRSGSSNDTDIINIRLYNDTNLNGVFDPTSDSQIATAQNSTTAGQYVFAGINFNITTSAHSLFVVVNTSDNAVGKTFRFNINGTGDVNTIGSGSAFNITETLTTTEGSQVLIFGRLSVTGVSLVGGQGPTAPECAVDTKRCLPSNEANVSVMRLNFTATGEGVNISVIKFTRAASAGLTDDHIVNIRLVNDTNGNGAFDATADTQLGSVLDVSVSNVYSFTGFQYNVSTSGVNTLFVVINTTARLGWDPQVYFNLTLNATTDINSISAISSENITETITQTHSNTTQITYKGWYNITKHETAPLTPGWNSFTMPTQTLIESTKRNASTTGNFNFTSILSSIGSNWNFMYYNINGTATGWILADRTDPGGSTLRFVNNTNADPYWINMTATDRFEL